MFGERIMHNPLFYDIDKAAGLVSQAGSLEIGSTIFVLNMGVLIKILVLV